MDAPLAAQSVDIVVLREAPLGWAKELAEALGAQGIACELEAELDAPRSRRTRAGRSEEPSCLVLVSQADLARALPVDEQVYRRQVPEARGVQALLDESGPVATETGWLRGATGDEPDAGSEAVGDIRGSLLRTAVFILAMLLFYVLRARLGG